MKALVEMATGRVAQVMPDGDMFPVSPALMWLSIPEGADVKAEWAWDANALQFIPPKPSDGYIWDGVSWELPAPALRADLLARVNALRLQRVSAGLAVTVGDQSYVLQTDDYSRENIDRAAIGVSIGILPLNADGTPNNAGTGTHISWRMRDNSDVLMDGPTFLSALAVPLGLHVNGCHLAARSHKAAIEAAANVDLPTYDLSAGWPAIAPAE